MAKDTRLRASLPHGRGLSCFAVLSMRFTVCNCANRLVVEEEMGLGTRWPLALILAVLPVSYNINDLSYNIIIVIIIISEAEVSCVNH